MVDELALLGKGDAPTRAQLDAIVKFALDSYRYARRSWYTCGTVSP